MRGTTSFVHVGAQVDGLHYWSDAVDPDRYLRSPHRHLFVVTARIEVFHDDREIEINAAARWLTTLLPTLSDTPYLGDGPVDFGPQSCETLATRIIHEIGIRYGPHRQIDCTVLEDGLLGAGITRYPTATEPGS